METQTSLPLGKYSHHSTGKLAYKLSKLGWSLFLIWVGIALLSGLGEGIGFLGAGIITLGVQGLRKYYGLKLERFWVAGGTLFVIGGLWKLFEIGKPMAPFILIIAGLALLASLLKERSSK